MRAFRWLGRFTMIAGPMLVLLVFVLAAFLMWVLVTSPGTRWALTTAVGAMGGQVSDVRGSLWKGLEIGRLSLEFPGVALQLEDAALRADWRRLAERQLHVHALQARTAWVDLKPTEDEPEAPASEEPFSVPELPVSMRIDDVSLGELILTQSGEPVPVTIRNFASGVAVGGQSGQLWLRRLDVATESLEAELGGEANLLALAHPWPSEIDLDVIVNGVRPGAPVCFRQMMPTLPAGRKAEDAIAKLLAGVADAVCPLHLRVTGSGSLDSLALKLEGDGQGVTLHAAATLEPMQKMPLRSADVVLELPDGSSLKGHAGWDGADALAGELKARRLDAGHLSGGVIPPAVLDFDSRIRLELDARQTVRGGEVSLSIHEGSRWNDQPLSGSVDVRARLTPGTAVAEADQTAVAGADRPAGVAAEMPEGEDTPALLRALVLDRLNIDLALGKNQVRSSGGIGAPGSRLELNVEAPRLADFWPGVPGAVAVQGHVEGALAAHAVALTGRYTPSNGGGRELGSAPVSLDVRGQGGWGGDPEGWRGRIDSLQARHAHLGMQLGAPLDLSYVPGATAPAWQWTAGSTEIALSVNGRRMMSVRHGGSRGGAGRWETDGRVERFLVSPQVLRQIGKDFDISALNQPERGGVKVRGARAADDWEIAFGLDWNLRYDGAHAGTVRLRRLGGDVMVPGTNPFPLELQALELALTLVPDGEARSRLDADLDIATRRMGRITADVDAVLRATPGGGIVLSPSDPRRVTLDAAVADLGWTSLLLGDDIDLGGSVQANLRLDGRPDGSWVSAGTIQGKGLRFVMIDQGVRLLDGTLQARLDNERLVLERLAFPARLRAEPKEWRTAEWISTNPDAKGGSLVVTGDWNLVESRGAIEVALYRFPILQRADRYAMMTGGLKVEAALPDLDITGKLTADAGWFDLDMLGGIPTVDSDVVVIRPGDAKKEVPVPLGMTLDLEVDLGPRFYLTGYGLNSGLVGSMRVLMKEGKLTGVGALRTRGGAIEAYGQRLQLRRGVITFQGDITRPVLDIEALRTGLAVEAGVRVAGTARRPRIELVSYPAVSEIEKLSWLLLGHGPNDSGGDMALLFSVGTSFLTDGEPFYRRFGIDEVSMRSGELASVASVLPAESVVSGLDTGTSAIERRFINISKRLSDGLTVSIRQALSETGTVALVSYRLARGLTAEASLGTVNGLALVYRWFSREESRASQQ